MFNRFAVILVVCCCLKGSAAVRAADVALVTEKTGTVQASLAGDEWNVELAEMLPDGVEIKVSEDGSLVLVHLPTNQEYRFEPQATAKLTLAAVTGEKFTASAVELVSADLKLSQSMSNQTGAVEPGRVNVAVPAPPPPPAAAPAAAAPAPANEALEARKAGPRGSMIPQEESKDSSVENFSDAARESASPVAYKAKEPDMPPKAMKEEFDSAAPVMVPELDASADQEAGAEAGIAAGGSSNEESAVLAGAAPAAPVFRLAFPAEVFAKFCSDETGLKVKTDKYLVSRVNYPAEGWVEVEIEGAENFAGTLNFEGNLATFSVDVVVVGAILIIDAWKLEKSGKPYQAAAMWLALQKSGLAPEKVAPNLKRLKETILKANK